MSPAEHRPQRHLEHQLGVAAVRGPAPHGEPAGRRTPPPAGRGRRGGCRTARSRGRGCPEPGCSRRVGRRSRADRRGRAVTIPVLPVGDGPHRLSLGVRPLGDAPLCDRPRPPAGEVALRRRLLDADHGARFAALPGTRDAQRAALRPARRRRRPPGRPAHRARRRRGGTRDDPPARLGRAPPGRGPAAARRGRAGGAAGGRQPVLPQRVEPAARTGGLDRRRSTRRCPASPARSGRRPWP